MIMHLFDFLWCFWFTLKLTLGNVPEVTRDLIPGQIFVRDRDICNALRNVRDRSICNGLRNVRDGGICNGLGKTARVWDIREG